jgi:hypothetical protein
MAMKLTDEEKAMLDGREGPAVQKAMDLLVRYGEALDAERLVDTNNVCGAMTLGGTRGDLFQRGGFHAVFSELNLDSQEVVEIPCARVYTCQLEHGLSLETAHITGGPLETMRSQRDAETFFGARGVHMLATCTPYLVGNVPILGEHCAWMESSAVVYCNSVLGARTNTEGTESTGAASLTGKIPYWGYHIPECRRATHLVEVDVDVDSVMDWGLLGYYVGEMVQEAIPVIKGIRSQPDVIKLKHLGAAAASSGGVEMYHIPGITPEAPSVETALRGNKPAAALRYGRSERRTAYENLNSSATSRDVDFIMLGCPHCTLEQVWGAARLLEGKRLHGNTQLWLFVSRALKEVADRSGYTKIIEDAGAHVLTDTCCAISGTVPKGTKVVATDSAKQAHYLPAMLGVQTWFGATEECIQAATTGRWSGGLA